MNNSKIILFDGVCNLCNTSVQFVIKNDKKNIFKYASLQSDFGQKLLNEKDLDSNNFDSFILLDNQRIYQKSTAALLVAKHLSWQWQWLQLFWLIPTPVRDLVYNFIAKNRYRWFGKKESCWIPTPEMRKKFLN